MVWRVAWTAKELDTRRYDGKSLHLSRQQRMKIKDRLKTHICIFISEPPKSRNPFLKHQLCMPNSYLRLNLTWIY